MLSAIYCKVMNVRNALYDRGTFEVHGLGARTISVGNITVGGTGKTPLVAKIAEMLAEKGEKVCILTRGYGRKHPKKRVLVSDGEAVLTNAEIGGDEPVELAQKLLGKAVVVADADRVAAAEWASSEFGITAFVLDDGFQHRRAKRDLDIVCIDATNPFGGGRTLPAGRLREPLAGLTRADAVIITRALSAPVSSVDRLEQELADFAPDAVIFRSTNSVRGLRTIGGGSVQEAGNKFIAFCGIGNPEHLFDTARTQTDGRLVGTLAFADHHRYTQDDIEKIENFAREMSADAMLTSAKDAVKLDTLKFSIPCFVMEIEPVVEPAYEFEKLIFGE
jgi:tetraacyldisaccharide 4'-kinase